MDSKVSIFELIIIVVLAVGVTIMTSSFYKASDTSKQKQTPRFEVSNDEGPTSSYVYLVKDTVSKKEYMVIHTSGGVSVTEVTPTAEKKE